MRNFYEVGVSFDTEGGEGNINIALKHGDVKMISFHYKQLGDGSMYHNHPIRMTEGSDVMREDVIAALKEGAVWGVRVDDKVPEDWIISILKACEIVWGVGARLQA